VPRRVIAPAIAGGGFHFDSEATVKSQFVRPISQYNTLSSWVRELDPRLRLAAFLMTVIVTALLRTPTGAALALGATFLLIALARVPLVDYLRVVGRITPFLLLFVIWLPWMTPGQQPAGTLAVSREGLSMATVLLLKAVTLVSLGWLFLAAVPLTVTFQAAGDIGIPTFLITIAALTCRHVILIGDEFRRRRLALRVRGFQSMARMRGYRAIGYLMGTLLLHADERAERVGQAMRCRAFQGKFRSLNAYQTGTADAAWFLGIGAGATMIWLIDHGMKTGLTAPFSWAFIH
jgi:cobalt/nickel transport system permease protein